MKGKLSIQKLKKLPYWLRWIIIGASFGFILSLIILLFFIVPRMHHLVAIEYFPRSLYHLLDITFDLHSMEILSFLQYFGSSILLFGILSWIISEIVFFIKKHFTIKFMRRATFIIGIIILIFAIYSIIWNVGLAKTKISANEICQEDSDCIKVSDGCCGCGGGGTNKAVNKNTYISPDCEGIGCIMVMSNDWTCFAKPICQNNKCVLKESFLNHIMKRI